MYARPLVVVGVVPLQSCFRTIYKTEIPFSRRNPYSHARTQTHTHAQLHNTQASSVCPERISSWSYRYRACPWIFTVCVHLCACVCVCVFSVVVRFVPVKESKLIKVDPGVLTALRRRIKTVVWGFFSSIFCCVHVNNVDISGRQTANGGCGRRGFKERERGRLKSWRRVSGGSLLEWKK